MDELETREVVVGSLFERCDFAFADAYAENTIRSIAFDSFYKRRRAFVVEPGTIDQGLIFRQPEQSRSRVSRLWMKRDRACFDKTETERGQRSQGDAVLVEAGRETDGIRKQQSKPADWILRRAAFS